VGDLPTILSSDAEMPRQDMFFVESGKTAESAGSQTLLAHVSSDRYDLRPLLTGVFVAEDLTEALSRRGQLQEAESIVTKSGVVLGFNWAHVPRGQGPAAGLLEREEELSRLREEVPAIESRVAESEQELGQMRVRLHESESQQSSARDRAGAILQKLNTDRQTYADRQARFDQIEGRRQQLADESEEIVLELGRTGSELDEARRHFAIAEDETGALERQRKDLLEEKEVLTRTLSEARAQTQAAQDRRHETELTLQHSQASLESHHSSLARLQAQSGRMRERYEQLKQQLSTGEDPGIAMGDRLQTLLSQRSDAEQALAEGRNRHAAIEQEIRQVQGTLSECEQEVASAREILESKRLKDQELTVRLQTLEEQIAQDQYVLSELLEILPQEAEEGEWTARSERLAQKIANIGPVNLVAIEEYEEQAERKAYLDSQHADLIEALETLSGVIRKIDRETRERFKTTFDSLNQGFSDFFPQLFGGGHAVLQLTDEDLLAAGVTVMARPPGKRNSTIHLLSGGEKALTAVALLFALFKLNPAPFCILDEVDAPLDDRNVERYCKTLRTLSEVSQLVVITHNKITMESADILLGVTMGEPGVSSIVSVDIDEAVRLAAH
jgi:chromosome segregation protein